ncbi:MAG: hypothetical protein R3C28_19270 [Pirellulaceae bacterium]
MNRNFRLRKLVALMLVIALLTTVAYEAFVISFRNMVIDEGQLVVSDAVSFERKLSLGNIHYQFRRRLPGFRSVNHIGCLYSSNIHFLAFFPEVETIWMCGIAGTPKLDPLRHCRNLREFSCPDSDIFDLQPLQNCSSLRKLEIPGSIVTDVTSLKHNKKLEYLDLSRTKLESLTPLAGLGNLAELHLSGASLKDWSSLSSLNQLRRLDLAGSNFSDSSLLGSLGQLTSLNVAGTRVDDLNSLTTLINLSHLDIRETEVRDFSALTNLRQLESLAIQINCTTPQGLAKQLDALSEHDWPRLSELTIRVSGPIEKFEGQIDDIASTAELSLDLSDTFICEDHELPIRRPNTHLILNLHVAPGRKDWPHISYTWGRPRSQDGNVRDQWKPYYQIQQY